MTEPLPLSPDLEIGQHVLYIEGDKIKDALILVKFSERTWPSLTLITVRPRSHGDGLVIKSAVPHQSRMKSERGYWRLPPGVEPRPQKESSYVETLAEKQADMRDRWADRDARAASAR